VDEEYSWAELGTLHIISLNLTLTAYQYAREQCAFCSQGFAIWVCAEDLNPEWWSRHRAAAASFLPVGYVLQVYAWIALKLASMIAL